jgi:HlyD family secretion protein
MTRKRALRRGLAALALLLVVGLAAAGWQRFRPRSGAATLPTTRAARGEFACIVRCRGELKARRSLQMAAPANVPELRIVWLAPPASTVQSGDVVIRFDPSSARQQLQEKEAVLKQAQAALDQAVAQEHIAVEQDKVDTATARYEVEKGRLEVSKAEIERALDAEISRINLDLAERKLRAQKAGVDLNRVSGEAKVASLTRARDKARDEVQLAQYRLGQMERKAPLTGMINYLPNYSQGWVNAKPFKVGDQVWPGASIAEIPDLESIEMEGKVEEIDRGLISVGQDARIRIDALPEVNFTGKLTFVSPMIVMGWDWPPTRTFRAHGTFTTSDGRLRPGMNGAMDVITERLRDAITLPKKALFTHAGKPVVYDMTSGVPRAREVQVLARNPDEVAVKGLAAGTPVSLAEPEAKERTP